MELVDVEHIRLNSLGARCRDIHIDAGFSWLSPLRPWVGSATGSRSYGPLLPTRRLELSPLGWIARGRQCHPKRGPNHRPSRSRIKLWPQGLRNRLQIERIGRPLAIGRLGNRGAHRRSFSRSRISPIMACSSNRNGMTPAGIARPGARQIPRPVSFSMSTFKNSTKIMMA